VEKAQRWPGGNDSQCSHRLTNMTLWRIIHGGDYRFPVTLLPGSETVGGSVPAVKYYEAATACHRQKRVNVSHENSIDPTAALGGGVLRNGWR